jgi:4-carboxymuconolactone decarboxylase
MSERRDRGVEMIKEVYAGDVIVPPEGMVPFNDVMLEQLFAEVWTRGELSMRDRRLLLLGAIAAMGEEGAWLVQIKAAVKRGELTIAQVHEVLVQLGPYAGYPRLAGLMVPTLKLLAELLQELGEQ